jgi:predicted nucleic acid-binding protein
MQNRVFLDTSYAIALASAQDAHHNRAISISLQLEADSTALVTTRAILLEVGNALSKQHYRHAAIQLLTEVETDPQVEIMPITESIYHHSFRLYQASTDKEWGMTDCLSFVVMQEQNLTEALTADVHFQQAGFRALLRET